MISDIDLREHMQTLFQAHDPLARVHKRWVGDVNEAKWAGKLCPKTGAKKGLIYAVVITRRNATRRVLTCGTANGVGKKINHTWVYRISFYEGFRDEGDGALNNSEDSVSQRVESGAELLARLPQLGLATPGHNVTGHKELQPGLIATVPFNNELVTLAHCTFEVSLYDQITAA